MANQLKINGVDLSQYVTQDQWSTTQNFGRGGDTFSIVLTDFNAFPTPTFVVKPLETIVVKDTVLNGGTVIFGGVCNDPMWTQLSPTVTQWTLNCKGYDTYANSAIVNADYVGMQADDIIIAVCQLAGIGITAVKGNGPGYINPGPTINRVRLKHKTLTEAIQRIATLASQTSNYGYYIDENFILSWFNQDQALNSGITFTDNPTGDPTSTIGFVEQDNVQYEWDGTNLATVIVVDGGKYKGHQIDNFTGTGNQTAWPLSYEIDTSISAPKLTIAGVKAKVQVLSGPTQTSTDDFVITQGTSGQYFLQVNVAAVPSAGAPIVLDYTTSQPVIAQASDPAAVAEYSSGPNGGRFQKLVTDTSLLTQGAAYARAQRELVQFAYVKENLTITTAENWPGHLKAGFIFTFIGTRIPDSQNDWNAGINDTFIATQVKIDGQKMNRRKYTITGVRV